MSGRTMDQIRPATAADVQASDDRPIPYRLQAVAVEDRAGRLLGVGGIAFQPNGLTAFLDIAPDVDPRRHRRAIVKAGRRVMALAAASGRPIFVARDPHSAGSETLLTHFGFVPVDAADEQEIWLWQA